MVVAGVGVGEGVVEGVGVGDGDGVVVGVDVGGEAVAAGDGSAVGRAVGEGEGSAVEVAWGVGVERGPGDGWRLSPPQAASAAATATRANSFPQDTIAIGQP